MKKSAQTYQNDQFLNLLQQSINAFKQKIIDQINPNQLPSKVIFIIGEKQVGKTCFIHYLNQSIINSNYNSVIGQNYLEIVSPSKNVFHFKKQLTSQTTIEIIFSLNQDNIFVQLPVDIFLKNHQSEDQQLQMKKDIERVLIKYLLKNAIQFQSIFLITSQFFQNAIVFKEEYQKFLNQFILQGDNAEDNEEIFRSSISIIISKIEQHNESSLIELSQVLMDLAQQEGETEILPRFLSRSIEDRNHSFSNSPIQKQGQKLMYQLTKDTQYIAFQNCKCSFLDVFQESKIYFMAQKAIKLALQSQVKLQNFIFNIIYQQKQQKKSIKDYNLYLKFLNTKIDQSLQMIKQGSSKNNANVQQIQSIDLKLINFIENKCLQLEQFLSQNLMKNIYQQIQKVIEYCKQAQICLNIVKLKQNQISFLFDVMLNLKIKQSQNQIKYLIKVSFIKKICENNKLEHIKKMSKEMKDIRKSFKKNFRQKQKTYEELFNQYNTKTFQEKMSILPNKILKFDFIHRKLIELESQNKDKHLETKLLIYQSIKILQIQNFIQESIIFMMVLPDFNRIQQILDQQILKKHQQNQYWKSKLSNQFLQNLSEFAEKHLRDEIVIKCTKISNKGRQQNQEVKKKKDNLKNSLNQRIEKLMSELGENEKKVHYNFNNYSKKDILSKQFREQLVQKGKNCHQDENKHITAFEFLKKNIEI